ncbi:hypothetical protein ACKFKF_19420 [Phormidesmis sp. 146-12]
MQKLVTIYLDREGYRRGKESPSESHGVVEEHLGDFLAAGWQIKLITAGGGGVASGGGIGAGGVTGLGCCWVVVVLEKL